MPNESSIPHTSIHRIQADGITVFYREAGPVDAPVVLLLHGFPTSSFQYRELIPRLADRYRVIAPDLPGFGFTDVPRSAVTSTPLTRWRTRSSPSPMR
jgi:pimeloyl-ACP methyl ester carboxylesterase